MLKSIFKSPSALFYAILVHVVLFAILTVNLDWVSEPEEPVAPVNIVKATSVDEKKVQDQLNKLKKAEKDRIKKEKQRQKKLEREAEKAKKKRQAEERRLRELEKRRLQEKQKLENQKKAKTKELAKLDKQKKEKEKKLKDLKKKQEVAQRKEEQRIAKARAEKKRVAEEAAKRKIEEEKRRKAEEEEMLHQAMLAEEKALFDEQMAAEDARLAAENEKQAQSVIAQYVGLIRQKVERNWRKPSAARSGLKCTVFVQLIPGGGIAHVEITKSSGDGIFDSSVEKAVRKSEPLPVPPDPDLFDRFRNVNFVFDPDKMK